MYKCEAKNWYYFGLPPPPPKKAPKGLDNLGTSGLKSKFRFRIPVVENPGYRFLGTFGVFLRLACVFFGGGVNRNSTKNFGSPMKSQLPNLT